jgi:uncharacterized OB-fold protein
VCPECLNAGLAWEAAPTTGRVWSVAVYHRALHPGFRDDVPYGVAMVRLDAGPSMVGRVAVGVDVGDAVEVAYDDVDARVTLVRFAAATRRPR